MKKILSLILIMTMLFSACAWAEEKEDWYLVCAAELIEDMKELSADAAYLEMMGGSEEARTLIEGWNQAMMNEPVSILKGSLPLAQILEAAALAEDMSEVAHRQVSRYGISTSVNQLIGQNGVNFLLASSITKLYEYYIMPEAFEPCVVVWEYEDFTVVVSFEAMNENIVQAVAQFGPTEICSRMVTENSEGTGAVINEELKRIFGK